MLSRDIMVVLSLLSLLPVILPAQQTTTCIDVRARAAQGQPGPEGGRIADATLPYGANLGAGGRIAFTSQIVGLARNQAVIVSDGESLRTIAVGCGGIGGSGAPGSCGDPTPIGGTFAGFFTDPWHAPAMNAAGDVLFLADVFGGASPRALFLHKEATGAIESVAAVGQLSPTGTAITGLGPGSVDPEGRVTFLARTDPGIGRANEILAYESGVLSLVAREGSAGPDGPYDAVSGELQLFPDGTSVAAGPVPARDDRGRVVHFGATATTQLFGIVVQPPGQPPVWLATFHQPTPVGGVFLTFGAPMFAPNGDVFFSAQYSYGSGTRAGWFAGLPGSLRRVLVSSDSVGTSTCLNFARSRNPFQAVGRSGEVVLWTRLQHADLSQADAHVVVRPGGVAEVLAETGDPAPAGGVIAELGQYPSIDTSGRVLESARVDLGPTSNAIWLVFPCGTSVSFCEGKSSSLGCVPRIRSIGRASVSSAAAFLVTADSLPSHRNAILFYGLETASTPFQGGTLCVAQPLRRTPVQTSSGPSPSDCTGTLLSDFGARIASGVDPALSAGTTIAAQWFVRDPLDPQGFGTTMSDAITFTIAP